MGLEGHYLRHSSSQSDDPSATIVHRCGQRDSFSDAKSCSRDVNGKGYRGRGAAQTADGFLLLEPNWTHQCWYVDVNSVDDLNNG